MDLSATEPLPEMSESSGEYRLRFRYRLWSQAAQDFRSRPPAPQRFASTGSNGPAIGLHPSTPERQDAAESGSVSASDRER
jgi:hypothetical protein